MSYILLDKAGREVPIGARVLDPQWRRWFVTGNSDRSVFVVQYLGYPELHAQAFSPDVFGLRIEERTEP